MSQIKRSFCCDNLPTQLYLLAWWLTFKFEVEVMLQEKNTPFLAVEACYEPIYTFWISMRCALANNSQYCYAAPPLLFNACFVYYRIVLIWKCRQKDLGVVFLQVIKSEKPGFHVAFELLFLHGVLQLFVKPDVASEFLQVTEFFFHFIISNCNTVFNSVQTMITFCMACDLLKCTLHW